MKRALIILAFPLLLAACFGGGDGPDLAEQAKTATLTYTAATKNAQVILKADFFGPKTEDCIKAADTVAWGYQDELNLKAQEWLKAGAEDRKPIEDAVTHIQTLFNAATLNLTGLMSGNGVC